MAKFSADNNTKVAAFETPDRVIRYTLRSDGKVLRQLRIAGKLEHAVIATWQLKPEFRNDERAFARACSRRQATERVL